MREWDWEAYSTEHKITWPDGSTTSFLEWKVCTVGEHPQLKGKYTITPIGVAVPETPGGPARHVSGMREGAAKFIARSPSMYKALKAIASGDGDAREIARQELARIPDGEF